MTDPSTSTAFDDIAASDLEPTAEFAARMDELDPLSSFRESFHVPRDGDGRPVAYFVGNSLGLQPREARGIVEEVMDDWARLAVDGHFDAERPWYPFHEQVRDELATVVGAKPAEVVAMNTLTVNLHLLLMTFHQPKESRRRILIEDGAFPSDTYAVGSHVAARGGDPTTDVVRVAPRPGEDLLRTEDVVAEIRRLGATLSTIMLGGVNFRTGQLLDIGTITAAGHEVGATVGFDLAHAAGNVPLRLHEDGVDYAAWCSYKYLNSGPGAVAGAFINERHASNLELPRFAGWWGNDPSTRFRMHLEDSFVPVPTAEAWQLSNPPILSMAPLVASLDRFIEAGMDRLRSKSRALTGYLHACLQEFLPDDATIVTPSNAEERGCQLTVRLAGDARSRFERLAAQGVIADFRPPDLVRLAPVPLYNTFADCFRAASALEDA